MRYKALSLRWRKSQYTIEIGLHRIYQREPESRVYLINADKYFRVEGRSNIYKYFQPNEANYSADYSVPDYYVIILKETDPLFNFDVVTKLTGRFSNSILNPPGYEKEYNLLSELFLSRIMNQ